MIPIPHTDLASEAGSVEAWRVDLAVGIGDYDTLAARPWSEISGIEIFPNSRLSDPVIIVPEAWMPGGALRRPASRSLDLRDLLGSTGDLSGPARVRDESVRRALLALWLPRRTDTGIRQYAPSSWLSRARLFMQAVGWQVIRRPSTDGRVWAHLSRSDLRALLDDVGTTDRGRVDALAMLRGLADAGKRGILSDYPRLHNDGDRDTIATNGKRRSEPSYQVPTSVRQKKSEDSSWQPLPDEFVTELLRRGLWLQRNLGPQILECWSGLMRIVDEAALCGQTSGNPAVIDRRRRLIQAVDWRDAEGRPITRLPFAINQQAGQRTETSDVWPPRDASTIGQMVVVLQALNLCMVAFCTGARHGELASATVASLADGDTARFAAKTFKLREEVGGKLRDWPLHPQAVRAVALQMDLARRCRPDGTDHLWVMAGRATGGVRGLPLLNLTEPAVMAAKHLGLSHLAGRDRPHLHRWRHTMARLAALTVVSAPQVLMDLFGHRDLEMTLRYMLSNPEIAQEARAVAKEAAIALAEEALEDALAGAAAGAAAAPLKAGVEAFAMRQGLTALGTDDKRAASEMLTLGGGRWEIVRPGVICTKGPGQAGPCTRKKGFPDPGSCRTECGHRLEIARARAQCDGTIETLVTEIEAADADGADMLAASYEGQLLANLSRWDDLREAWIARSPTVARVWEERCHAEKVA